MIAKDARRRELLLRLRAQAEAPNDNPPSKSASSFQLPLSWVATTASHPDANLGDALSAVVVAAIAGLPVRLANFNERCERLVAVGTIGHRQRNGKVHFWGTGVDATRNAVGSPIRLYIRPPATEFRVHAVRGEFSAQTLRANGIEVPPVYGDPVWFLPRLFPRTEGAGAELGIVVHITELESHRADATVRKDLRRYGIPPSLDASIRLINTYTDPALPALRAKVAEIVSCKRILSTSLHGLVIAEAYGIPCAWFAPYGGGAHRLPVDDPTEERIDHRIRDFYSGVERDHILAFCQDRSDPTDWEAALRHLDSGWEQLGYDGRALFDAFPLPLAVRFSQKIWPVDETVMSSIRF